MLHPLSIDRLDHAFCTFGQTYRNRTESTAIVQKEQIVRDVRVKRTIRRSLRVRTGFLSLRSRTWRMLWYN